MFHPLSRLVAVAVVLSAPFSARAGVIEYELANIGGSTWQYDYTVTNETLPSLYEFTIWFDGALATNLNLFSSPAAWDSIVVQPDATIPHDGFFDSLNLDGLAMNGTASGFAIRFDWLGLSAPGAQRFEFLDADTFEVLDSGSTQLRAAPPPPSPTSVPEPGTLALLIAGLIGFLCPPRRRESTLREPADATA